MPQMLIAPREGARLPVSICIVVVFPAPFGPRKPSTSPRRKSRSTPLTAMWPPKLRVSPRAEIVAALSCSGIVAILTVKSALVECTKYT